MSAVFIASASFVSAQTPGTVSGGRTVLSRVTIPSAVASAQALGATDGSQVIHLSIGLPSQNLTAFQAYADAVSDPQNPLYGHFLTPAQVGAQFGLPSANVQAVVNFLTSNGLTVVRVAQNHMAIIVDGTVAQVEKAFQTTIGNFHALSTSQYGRTNFYSFETPVSVPTNIASDFLSISGLQNYDMPRPLHSKAALKGKQSAGILTVNQGRTLYNTAPFVSAGFAGKNRTMGISNWDGFRLSNVPLLYAQYGLPTPTGGVGSNVTVEAIQGGSGSGTPGAEGDLDIQMELGMAPLANLVIYDGGGDLLSVLTAEADDNKADVISESWEWTLGDSDYESAHQQHLAMTTQGITYMSAAGDTGTTFRDIYPHIDPEVLSIGGTIATTTSAGVRTSEVAWGGGGGGWNTISVSPTNFNLLPSWQRGSSVPTNHNFRMIPDISFNAAGDNGAWLFYYNGSLQNGYDGTSFASPICAGCLTTMESKLVTVTGSMPTFNGISRLGRLQSKIYPQNGRSDIYYDITQGSNGSLPDGTTSNAKAGWDFTTGWGAVNFYQFAQTYLAPIQVTPLSVSIYQSQGKNLTGGTSSLSAVDNVLLTEQSVTQTNLGQVAALQFQFTPQQVSQISSMSFQVTGYATEGVSFFVYLVNPVTGSADLAGTIPMNTLSSTTQLGLSNYSKYVDSRGHVTMITRAVASSRLSATTFLLKLDQVELYEKF